MLDKNTKQRIIEEETTRFMDDNFGQLDLSGSPDLNNPPAEEKFELQDRYVMIEVVDTQNLTQSTDVRRDTSGGVARAIVNNATGRRTHTGWRLPGTPLKVSGSRRS
jgi:hypothetical protein